MRSDMYPCAVDKADYEVTSAHDWPTVHHEQDVLIAHGLSEADTQAVARLVGMPVVGCVVCSLPESESKYSSNI